MDHGPKILPGNDLDHLLIRPGEGGSLEIERKIAELETIKATLALESNDIAKSWNRSGKKKGLEERREATRLIDENIKMLQGRLEQALIQEEQDRLARGREVDKILGPVSIEGLERNLERAQYDLEHISPTLPQITTRRLILDRISYLKKDIARAKIEEEGLPPEETARKIIEAMRGIDAEVEEERRRVALVPEVVKQEDSAPEEKNEDLSLSKEVTLTPELKPDVKSFSVKEIEVVTLQILGEIERVKKIESLQIVGFGNELNVDAKITASRWGISTDITLSGQLVNHDGSVIVKPGYKLSATAVEGTVKDLFVEHMGSLGDKIKKVIQKQERKEVAKLEIKDGKLEVTFVPEVSGQGDLNLKGAPEVILTPEEEHEKMINTLKAIADRNHAVALEMYAREQEILKRLEEIRREKETNRLGSGEEAEKIAADREQHPFKYYLLENLSPEIFELLFFGQKNRVSLEQIYYIFGEEGKDVRFWNVDDINEFRDTVRVSSNGFLLQLLNKEEVMVDRGGVRKPLLTDRRARYKVLAPNGRQVETGLDYNNGLRLIDGTAYKYQDDMEKEFEAKSKSSRN